MVDNNGNETDYVYDGLGQLLEEIDAAGNLTATAYSPAGLPIGETNKMGVLTTFFYDSRGNQTDVYAAANYSSVTQHTHTDYYADDEVADTVDPFNQTTYIYPNADPS